LRLPYDNGQEENENIGIPTNLITQLPYKGQYPQLAALPFLRRKNDWKLNRRLFENRDSSACSEPYPRILSSVNYFLKKPFEDMSNTFFFGYYNHGVKQMFTPVWIKNDDNYLCPKINMFKKSGFNSVVSDTLISDWFRITDLNNMYYYTSGMGDQLGKMYIERELDGKKINIPFIPRIDSNFTKYGIKLIKGNNNIFRICWVKNSRLYAFGNEIVMGILPNLNNNEEDIDNSKFPKSNLIRDYSGIINLGDEDSENIDYQTLDIYPNPTDDELFVKFTYISSTCGKNEKIELKITISTLQGIPVFTKDYVNNGLIRFSTNKLLVGTYMLKCEVTGGNGICNYSPLTKPFVIMR